MDTHIHPYFSSNAVQLEVDIILFGKAAEAHDSIAAKRVFVDMAIHPVQLCRLWYVIRRSLSSMILSFLARFCSLFVDALPPDYQYRVWDIFLFEGTCPFLVSPNNAFLTDNTGVVFLFRVDIAILSCCKHIIMDAANRDDLIQGRHCQANPSFQRIHVGPRIKSHEYSPQCSFRHGMEP